MCLFAIAKSSMAEHWAFKRTTISSCAYWFCLILSFVSLQFMLFLFFKYIKKIRPQSNIDIIMVQFREDEF